MYPRRWCRRIGVLVRYNIRALLIVVCSAFALAVMAGHIAAINGNVKQFRPFEGLVVDINEIEKHAVNKLVIEQQDGSVNIVFQLPASSKLSSDLRKLPVLSVKPSRSEGRVDINNNETKHDITPGIERSIQAADNNVKGVPADTSSMTFSDKTGVKHRGKLDDISTDTTKKNTQARFTLGDSYPLTIRANPYNIINKNICSGIKNLRFVVLVHSSTMHFERRSAIRETWASSKLFRNHTMKIAFLLGLPERESTQALIEHENVLHGDIIQGRFLDTYRNLTHKGVLGLRWVSEHCPGAKVVVKVDDDVFLNVFKVMDDVVNTYSKHNRQLWCSVRWNGTSPIQRRSGKWKIEEQAFYNLTHYPVTHCNGFFVILTADIIQELYTAAKSTPFFWVDDVYLFGMLVDKVGNITHTQVPNLNLNENKAIECFDSKDKPCTLLVANAHTEGVMDKLWYNALRQHKKLAKQYVREELIAG